jgi:hypothetical protein
MLAASLLDWDSVVYRRRALEESPGLQRNLVKNVEDNAQFSRNHYQRSAISNSRRG